MVGTGDVFHPSWFKELTSYLKPSQSGYLLGPLGIKFIPSVETCCKWSGCVVHNILVIPSLTEVQLLRKILRDQSFDIDTNGRPTFSMSCEAFVKTIKFYSPNTEVIPAHVWTPWTSVYGARNHFDTIADCYGSQTDKIKMLETGLSSDPEMNAEYPDSSHYTLVSFGDSHTANTSRLGREAVVLDHLPPRSSDLLLSFNKRDPNFKGTIEFNPEAGKYHFCGHKDCGVSFSPDDCDVHGHICTKCGQHVTEGALHRQRTLSKGHPKSPVQPNWKLIPLFDLLNSFLSKKTAHDHIVQLHKHFRSEYQILLDAPEDSLQSLVPQKVVDAILLNRSGKIPITAGYDGKYGTIQLGSTFNEQQSQEVQYVENTLNEWVS